MLVFYKKILLLAFFFTIEMKFYPLKHNLKKGKSNKFLVKSHTYKLFTKLHLQYLNKYLK